MKLIKTMNTSLSKLLLTKQSKKFKKALKEMKTELPGQSNKK